MNSESVEEKELFSVPVGPKRHGETRIHRNPKFKDGLIKISPNYRSLADRWKEALGRFSHSRIIENLTYQEVDEKMRKVGSYLAVKGHKVALLYAKNCLNWALVDIASWNYGFITVPLYDTLGDEAMDHIINTTEGSILFASKTSLSNIIKFIKTHKCTLKEICLWEELTAQEKSDLTSLGVQTSSINSIFE